MEKQIIKFWSNGCGNCKALEPIMAEVKAEHKEIKFADVNTSNGGDDAAKYDVMTLPTLVFLKDGQMAGKIAGLKPKSLIDKKILEFFN